MEDSARPEGAHYMYIDAGVSISLSVYMDCCARTSLCVWYVYVESDLIRACSVCVGGVNDEIEKTKVTKRIKIDLRVAASGSGLGARFCLLLCAVEIRQCLESRVSVVVTDTRDHGDQ